MFYMPTVWVPTHGAKTGTILYASVAVGPIRALSALMKSSMPTDKKYLASSKSCSKFEHQLKILKIEYSNNISFSEANKLVPIQSQYPTFTYSAAISFVPFPTAPKVTLIILPNSQLRKVEPVT